MIRLLAVLLLLPLAGNAMADDDVAGCDGSSQPEMTKCVWDAYRKADDELNTLWPEVLATIKPTDDLPETAAKDWKARLLAAQRAWATFKHEDCEGATAYEWYGGSGANAAVGACLYSLTRARIDDLKSRYTDK